MNFGLKAVVLAAGKGKRLQTKDSDAPKVMREACGKPLLWHVLDALSFIPSKDIIIVVGYKKEEVIKRFGSYAYAVQHEQLGTGHAVMSAAEGLSGFRGDVLVCFGDMPAIRRGTYEALIDAHKRQGNDCTILTGESEIPLAYGRILRDGSGGFMHVVEEKDCTADQLGIKELNTGVFVFRSPLLLDALKLIKNDNAQGEYYLTDVPGVMKAGGAKIGVFKRDIGDEMLGVNTLEHLGMIEEILMRDAGGKDIGYRVQDLGVFIAF